jgi:hypothetical protein
MSPLPKAGSCGPDAGRGRSGQVGQVGVVMRTRERGVGLVPKFDTAWDGSLGMEYATCGASTLAQNV